MEVFAAEESETRGQEDQTLEARMETCFPASPSLDATTRSPFHGIEEEEVQSHNTSYIASEEEKIQENDPEWNPSFPDAILENYVLEQVFKDDCFIPSPVIKSISKISLFGPDLISAFQRIGVKYNNLLRKYQVKNSEVEILQGKCEIMLNRCLIECQPKYETLEKKHSECQGMISETEALRAQCEALTNKCLQDCKPKYESLKDILAKEISERKRLHNELVEMKGNIRVFCRCRPLSADDISKGYNSVIEFDPNKDTELEITCADTTKKYFKFDHVFSPSDNQESVFSETIPVVKSVMDGFNACIFAYGQTGTGKTFTMEGIPESRGVNYRALEELFRISTQRSVFMRYEFSFSMLEVYNEKIKDLLADNSDFYSKKLDVKQSAEGTLEVPGLAEVQVCAIDEVWEMLQSGGRNRSVGATNANELSSRSHSLVRVTVKGENLMNGERNRSFLWLVDLAGSERVGKSEAEGERLKESQFINKSLSALGDVIAALASKNSHIPYRNSKLTHLLQSSLGGDCKTLMFAQISPSSVDLGETLCTLNFASRVRGVEHGPAKKHYDPADNFKLKQLTEKLRLEEKEVDKLNGSLQMMHIKYASRENAFKTLQEKIRESEQASKKYQQKIKDLENQLAEGANARAQAIMNISSRSSRPPLAPVRERPPLARITNRPPHFASHHRTPSSNLGNKENAYHTIKDITGFTKPLGRARRISLSPIVCDITQNKKRRATLATELDVLAQFSEKHHTNYPTAASRFSQSRIPRRISVSSTLNPLHETPNGQGKFVSSYKYSSSPLYQNQNFSGGGDTNSSSRIQPQNKLCYSIQKNVIVGSKKFLEHKFNEEALRAKEIVGGRPGVAQRVLNKNRRRTLMI